MIEEIKIDQIEELIQEMMKKIRDTYPTESREGNVITFDNGAAAPLVKCITEIQGSQGGSGTPSSDNVRPITSFTEGDIVLAGKNLLDDSKRLYTGNQIYFGSTSSSAEPVITLYPGTYTYKVQNADGSNTNLYMKDIIKNDNVPGFPAYNTNKKTFTITEKIMAIVWAYKPTYTSAADVSYAQIEYGERATDHENYIAPTTHKTEFTNPIYKGTEDVVTGKVTSEWEVVDLGDLTWNQSATSDEEKYRFSSEDLKSVIAIPAGSTTEADIICEIYAAETANRTYTCNNGVSINSQGDVFIYDSDKDTLSGSDFKTAVTGIKLAYKLATPTTRSETVSNSPVSSIHGFNTIYSTTGDLEVTYITEEFEALANVPAES